MPRYREVVGAEEIIDFVLQRVGIKNKIVRNTLTKVIVDALAYYAQMIQKAFPSSKIVLLFDPTPQWAAVSFRKKKPSRTIRLGKGVDKNG